MTEQQELEQRVDELQKQVDELTRKMQTFEAGWIVFMDLIADKLGIRKDQ